LSRPRPGGQRPGALVIGSDFKALAVIRSLARAGVTCAVLDNQPRSAWYSRHVRSRHRWPGPLDGDDFTAHLLRLAERQRFSGWLLFPTQDDAVRAVAERHAGLAAAYRLATPPWPALRRVHDKRCLNALADTVGVAHPATWYPGDETELGELPVTYPAIVKPTMSIEMQYRLGRKALPAEDLAGLRAGYRLAAGVVPPEELMVQELVRGAQYSVAAFCTEHGVPAAMTARRSRQYPPDFGLSSSLVEAVEIPRLLEIAAPLLATAGPVGMLELEFVLDSRDSAFKLLDANVRPWSWHGLCRACGIDFALLQYQWAMGTPIQPAPPRYGPKWVRLVTDVPAAAREWRTGALTLPGYARSLRGQRVPSVLDLRDPLPVVGDAAWLLRRARHRPRPVPTPPAVPAGAMARR